MKDNKDVDREKLDAEDIKIQIETDNPFLSKLSNFWYYHKWKVIVIAFFTIVFAVGIYQMATRDDVDEIIIVGTPVDLDAEQREEIDRLLTSQMPKNNDGSLKTLDIYNYTVFSEDEIDEANHSETDEEGKYVVKVSQSYNTSKIEEFNQFLSTGESSVLLVSEYLYNSLASKDKADGKDIRMSMEEIFGKDLPEGVMPDGCGIRLGDTEIYKYYEELQVLPEDTVVCVLRSYFYGASSDKEKHAASVELFKNIVTFGS